MALDPKQPYNPNSRESQADQNNGDRISKFLAKQVTPEYKPGSIAATPMTPAVASATNDSLHPLGQFDQQPSFSGGNYALGSTGLGPVQGTSPAPAFQEGNQGKPINLQPVQSNLPLYNAGMQPPVPAAPAAPSSGLSISSPMLNGLTAPASASQTITPANHVMNANVPVPSASQTITPANHVMNANVPAPSASQTITPANHILNLKTLHPSASATITPQNGISNGMPVAPGIVKNAVNPHTYRPGMHAATPMGTEQPDARHYRENSKLGGVAGSVSNLFGRLGDSGKHLAQGHVGQQYDQRRTSMLPGQGNVRLK
jgi:hypothetical protein